MKNHAQEVKNLLTDARQLCSALGWMAGAKPNGSGLAIRCPAHPDKNPSCGVTKGEDGTLRAVCFTCQWSADALGMIAFHDGLSTTSPDDFRDIMAHGAEIGGDLMLADEIRQGRPVPDREHVPVPPAEPPREYPDQPEVLYVWAQAKPPAFDAEALALLGSRSIDANAAAERALLRVFGPGQPLPPWATFGNASWGVSGHRLISRVLDADGAVRSLRAWQVDGKFGPKRVPPTGHKMAGLVLANREAAKILAGKSTADTVVICEGEPDWATWATRAPVSVAVFGIGSGGWTKEHASKLPKSCCVYVRTHCDDAGDKYASHVVETIGERCAVWRLTGPRGIDENDKAKAGRLDANPESLCEPVNNEARRVVSERPRVLTVSQILHESMNRSFDKSVPRVLTTGHWKIDRLTGGIRQGQSWVMGADTSWGKSSWAIACADENLKRGARVLIVSTEDDESVYGDRLMARRSGVEARRIRDRRLEPSDQSKITGVVSSAEHIPVYLDGRGVQWERLLRQAEEVVDGEAIDLVILDYVQELTTKQKFGDDRLMFKSIGQQFRHSFKARKIASMLLSQLTIADASKPPTKRDVRECKDLASGAEVVALGWTPLQNVTKKNDDGHDELLYSAGSRVLLIDKAKDGMKGSAELQWDEVTASFTRVDRPENDYDGYDIPGFQDTMNDVDDQFSDAF
jgi:replicative DNA helicase